MSSVLDMEVGDLGARLRAGFAWWIGELAAIAAPLLRQRGGTGRSLLAVRAADGGYELVRGGRVLAQGDGVRPVTAALQLPPDAWLWRETAAPGLSEGEWRRLLMDDVDRLTPFEAAEVYVAIGFLPGADGSRRALLGVAPRRSTNLLLAEALRGGVRPSALVGAVSEGVELDFLPAVRSARGLDRAGPSGAVWWGLVALLLAANVGAAIWRDVDQTRRLEATVADARPAAARIRLLRNTLQAEAAHRSAIDRARLGEDPLHILARLTRALPDGAWVSRLTLEQDGLRLTGRRRPGVDVASALQAQGFADVREASVDLAPAPSPPGAETPFDLVLRAAPSPMRMRR